MNSKKEYIEHCKTHNAKHLAERQHKVRFIRNKDKSPFGAIVTYWRGGLLHVGVSKCNPRDRFNRYIAVKKAIDHVDILDCFMPDIPTKCVPTFLWVVMRELGRCKNSVLTVVVRELYVFFEKELNKKRQ